jgi:hypothetical protein
MPTLSSSILKISMRMMKVSIKFARLGALLWCIALLALNVSAEETDSVPDCPPVESIIAYQLNGIKAASIEWLAPAESTSTLTGYTISRNNENIAVVDAGESLYVDASITKNGTFNYSIIANYAEGNSVATQCTMKVVATKATPVNDFSAEEVGWKGLRLVWNEPETCAPIITHYREGDLRGYGNGVTHMEAGLRFPQQHLAAYGDEVKISAVTIYPEKAFSNLTVNFYEVGAAEPFAVASADLSNLRTDRRSTLALTDTITIPTDKDIIVGFEIEAPESDDPIIKACYDTKRIGYTDLLRSNDGEFYSAALTWPMGLVTVSQSAPVPVKYVISSDDKQLTETLEQSYELESVENGTYNYSLAAVYSNNSKATAYLTVDYVRKVDLLEGVYDFDYSTNDWELLLTWQIPTIVTDVTETPDSYDIFVEDRKYNRSPIVPEADADTCTSEVLFTEDGTYQIRIDACYEETVLRGEPTSVTIYNGLPTLESDSNPEQNSATTIYYTLTGIRIPAPPASGPYIVVDAQKSRIIYPEYSVR